MAPFFEKNPLNVRVSVGADDFGGITLYCVVLIGRFGRPAGLFVLNGEDKGVLQMCVC